MLPLSEVLQRHPAAPLAWQAAQGAAHFLLHERPEQLAADTKSSPTDAVTEMDRGAEALLIAELLGARPQDGLLGEEGGERPGTSGARWVVDPLDGTVNYLYRLPDWGVSVAFQEPDGSAMASTVGVVVIPERGLGYLAVRGAGAWRVQDGLARALAGSACSDLSLALVATGFGYDSRVRGEQGAVAARLLPQIRDIRRSGSAVVDFCRLAEGQVDAFFERGLNPWDWAAGALIAAESGAAVRGWRGSAPDGELMVAAAPAIADRLFELVRLDAGSAN